MPASSLIFSTLASGEEHQRRFDSGYGGWEPRRFGGPRGMRR
jgi:hypothetical protein